MLYKAVGKSVPGLVFWSADSPDEALKHFRHGLKSPEDYGDVEMVPLTLADIEEDLKAKHAEAQAGNQEWSGSGVRPYPDEISGQVLYGADF